MKGRILGCDGSGCVTLGAAAILFFEFRQARNRLVELATGVAVAATFHAREATADHVNKVVGTGAESFRRAPQIGLGGWLIGLCDAGVIATVLGNLRRAPGHPWLALFDHQRKSS